MAYLRQDARTGNWTVGFRYQQREYTHSCKTDRKVVANRILAQIEETIDLLDNQRAFIPPGADPRNWIVSGRRNEASKGGMAVGDNRLDAVCAAYLKEQHQKAETTLCVERVHIRHLKRILRGTRRLTQIDISALQQYVHRRLKENYRGRAITGATVRKELVTFRQVWEWAQQRGQIESRCPLLGAGKKWALALPKPSQKPRFQTWSQIQRQVSYGGLTEQDCNQLWRSLFLDESQIAELLEHIEQSALHRFELPMFLLAAYSGARRSEICRSQVTDFDFEQNRILIRERKRRKDLASTTRFVPLHPRLKRGMQDWLDQHPGGRHTFMSCASGLTDSAGSALIRPLTVHQASYHFRRILRGSRWEVLSGFHVLRHSFGSNLARTGKVTSEVIGSWMGHTTTEMRELYQHLFPQDGYEQIQHLS